jgi:hypothetical protein
VEAPRYSVPEAPLPLSLCPVVGIVHQRRETLLQGGRRCCAVPGISVWRAFAHPAPLAPTPERLVRQRVPRVHRVSGDLCQSPGSEVLATAVGHAPMGSQFEGGWGGFELERAPERGNREDFKWRSHAHVYPPSCLCPVLTGFFCPVRTGVLSYISNGCFNPSHFCPSSSTSPSPVPVGAYSVAAAPLGLFVASSPCPLGSYCVGGLAQLCPSGRFGNQESLTSLDCSGPCSEGHFCPPGSVSATQAPCSSSARYYCPAVSHLTYGMIFGFV